MGNSIIIVFFALLFCLGCIDGAPDPLSQVIDCTKPNEKYDCGSPCQIECSTLGEPCYVASYRCVDACYCTEGFARDVKGNCIPTKECPSKSS